MNEHMLHQPAQPGQGLTRARGQGKELGCATPILLMHGELMVHFPAPLTPVQSISVHARLRYL